MGKRRRYRNSPSARFARYSQSEFVKSIRRDEKLSVEQKEYMKSVAKIEESMLSRTVFVQNVLDLNKPQNLSNLKAFMESRFGRVEKCEIAHFQSKKRRTTGYPPARVRFRNKEDAEKIFSGSSLKVALKTKVACPGVGNRGTISVQPSIRYKNMTEDVLRGDIISIQATGIASGSWMPSGGDIYENFCGSQVDCQDNIFLEQRGFKLEAPLTVSINLPERSVEISSKVSTGGSCVGSSVIDLISSLLEGDEQIVAFRFKDLRDHIRIMRDERARHYLVFALKWPPRLYGSNSKNENARRLRRTNFCDINQFGRRGIGLKVAIDTHAKQLVMSHSKVQKLRDFGVFPQTHNLGGRYVSEMRVVGVDACFQSLDTDLSEAHSSNPELGFLLRGLIDVGRCNKFDMLDDVVEYHCKELNLPKLVLERNKNCEEASITIQILEQIISTDGWTRFPCQLFYHLVQDAEQGTASSKEVHSYCCRVPRLLLSPTQVSFAGIENEMSNRVLRRFISEHRFHPCCFLRLQIGEENGTRLYNDDISYDVEMRIKGKIGQGVNFNGSTYFFLAYSSSQLKECSIWMVCPRRGFSVQSMRSSLGDFSGLTPSKYAARIGQCFSTTFEVAGIQTRINPIQVPDIPAGPVIEGPCKEHSDGTGLIRRESLDVMLVGVPFAPRNPNDVSIIQIRCGGAKGTLSAWDFKHQGLDPALTRGKHEICLRKSQTKFEASFDKLEICSVGKTIPYYLNRNVVLLLSVHHVPGDIFFDMQGKMLDDLDSMLTSAEAATEILPELAGPDGTTSSMLLDLLGSGFAPQHEPFMFSCLVAIRAHHLLTLRKKARILVRKGAVLMGGLDELAVLQEGEVFVQVSSRDKESPSKQVHRIIEGPVMVTKHPVMHQGDVRMLLAVNRPELRDHKNVVLFSQFGQRPEADKMSGSDLDGDEFAVTWDRRLFLKQWNCCTVDQLACATTVSLEAANDKPLCYEAPPAPTKIQSSDSLHQDKQLVDHFVNHMKNDNLGVIAMLWQDYASLDGASCPNCIELAELHSVAVDFPKTGVPAVIPESLRRPQAFEFAHWREVKGKPIRHCSGVIGKLYDAVVQRNRDSPLEGVPALAGRAKDSYGQILNHCSNRGPRLDAIFRPFMAFDKRDSRDDNARMLEVASEYRALYEEEVNSLMNKYKIRTEGELFTGCIRKFHKLHKRKQHAITEEVRRSCRSIREEHRSLFFDMVLDFVIERSEISSVPEDVADQVEHFIVAETPPFDCDAKLLIELKQTAFQLASAYYLSVYSPDCRARDDRSALFSFPWVVSDVIRRRVQQLTSAKLKYEEANM